MPRCHIARSGLLSSTRFESCTYQVSTSFQYAQSESEDKGTSRWIHRCRPTGPITRIYKACMCVRLSKMTSQMPLLSLSSLSTLKTMQLVRKNARKTKAIKSRWAGRACHCKHWRTKLLLNMRFSSKVVIRLTRSSFERKKMRRRRMPVKAYLAESERQ